MGALLLHPARWKQWQKWPKQLNSEKAKYASNQRIVSNVSPKRALSRQTVCLSAPLLYASLCKSFTLYFCCFLPLLLLLLHVFFQILSIIWLPFPPSEFVNSFYFTISQHFCFFVLILCSRISIQSLAIYLLNIFPFETIPLILNKI